MYNIVIFIVFSFAFLMYGFIGLVAHLESDELFYTLSSPAGPILSFLTIGFFGGLLLSGIVGGTWLGTKFIGRQGKKAVILAWVFAPLTFAALVLVGMVVAIPFAIYNIVIIKRGHETPKSPLVVTTYDEYFTSSAIINRDTLKKIKWSFSGKHAKLICGLILAVSVMAMFWAIYERYYFFISLGVFNILLIAYRYFLYPRQVIKAILQRAKETTGHSDEEVITSFTDEKIKLYKVNTGNTTWLDYGAIVRFADMGGMYVLYTKGNQFVLVDKAQLAQRQQNEAFIGFLKNKCSDLKI